MRPSVAGPESLRSEEVASGVAVRLFVGSKNKDKVREIQEILAAIPLDIRPLPAETKEVEESGKTLEENAKAKALGYATAVSGFVLADDTGLEVEALGGAPGVSSARFSGKNATYAQNRAKLLEALAGVPEERRGARFRCVIALARPGEVLATFEGTVEGRILEAPRGEGGFGYDPLFAVKELGRTLSELRPDEKNKVSHRALALKRAKGFLLELC